MNDKKILDRIIGSLQGGYMIDRKGDGTPFEYLDIKFGPSFAIGKDAKTDEEQWLQITQGMATWINTERAEEALNEKIRLEVKRQINKRG